VVLHRLRAVVRGSPEMSRQRGHGRLWEGGRRRVDLEPKRINLTRYSSLVFFVFLVFSFLNSPCYRADL
jgi:hypothetical protein